MGLVAMAIMAAPWDYHHSACYHAGDDAAAARGQMASPAWVGVVSLYAYYCNCEFSYRF